MSIIGSNILAGASGNQGAYNLNNSLRFRSSASAYLNRTPASNGNLTTWTLSFWCKRGALGSVENLLFMCRTGSSTELGRIIFTTSDTLDFWDRNSVGTQVFRLTTTQVFRDPSAWYHIVIVADTTQATAANRIKMYVNGTQVTAFGTATYPAQNATLDFNTTATSLIGGETASGTYFDGYMTEINFINAQALTPTSFGSTSTTTGSWIPKKYTGTYGTNGFYLNFSDIALTSGSNAGLGKDFSGNANYWTTNNISVTAGTTYDAMLDVCTNTSATVANYATLNPIRYGIYPGSPAVVLSEANLKASWAGDPGVLIGTMNIPSTGKWYWEAVVPTQTYNFFAIGVIKNQETASINQFLGIPGYCLYANSGQKWVLSSNSAYMAVPAQNTVITVAFDADTGTLYIGAGGSWANGSGSTNQAFSSAASIVTGLTGDISPAFTFNTGNFIANFGQRSFSYTPPTGYKALNTFNLPDSTIKKGNTVMDATIYTGDGASSRAITNAALFRPDFVWIKQRSGAEQHQAFDSIRGATKVLNPNLTNAESTDVTKLTAFNSNGFSLGSELAVNGSGSTYVGWQWQAGQGSTSSNTSGSITSTVSVNTTAGFSVVTWTANGVNGATVGHGLGVAPKWIIVKSRSNTQSWPVYHTTLGNTKYLMLNTTAAEVANIGMWNNTSPTSTVFTTGDPGFLWTNAYTYVAYCWAEIAGFSKFGSYTGNGSTDGPFVFTGFRPRWVMIKRTDTTGDWYMWDTARNTFDVITNILLSNSSAAETSATSIDALSNGFKLRNTTAGFNASGGTYIYMSYAENPFKNSNAF